ncbi:AraC family transcriptional regulator [Caulobacter segnis]|uniref:helix-turn-helix transcriptional regulator n=1 Tax=Caulobacter segnis TaxID=88688 RepID=UPI00240F4FCA|nr:AraC family transcriptional regulator [Caulobacter segnis]MDG2522290.1 AraC family transcriptional regulator [Caulobacter segnis]
MAGFKVGLWRASLPPEGVPTHVHEDAHFVLALDGGYRSLAHDPQSPRDASFGPGALLWNPPGVEHRDSFEKPGGRFLSVSFMPPKGAAQGDPLRLRDSCAGTAARRLVGRLARLSAGDEVAVEGLVLDMASAVLSAGELDEDPAPDWLLRADQMIWDLCVQPGLEVREVAREVGVHPVSLARRYRRHFGRSPATAIRIARADQAAVFVARGVDLAETADRAGYADQSHLTREFGAVYGLTPARYRAAFV